MPHAACIVLTMTTPVAEKVELHEGRGGGRISRQESSGDRYLVRYMGWDEGADAIVGSSAVYPVANIKASFAEAFPEGTRMRADHDGFCEQGGRMTKLMGYTLDTPVAMENGPEGPGMYGNIQVSSQWSGTVAEFAHVIGLSISGAGELEDFNNPEHESYDEDAPRTLKRFLSADENPYNAIDFVEAPGADGRIVALAVESARQKITEGFDLREQVKFVAMAEKKSPKAVPPEAHKGGNPMDEEAQALAIAEAVAAGVTRAVEALTPKEVPVEVKYEDVAEAAFEAGLSKGSRKGVYEAVRGGKPVDTAISEAKAREDEISAEITERLGATKAGPAYVGFGEAASAEYSLDELAGV